MVLYILYDCWKKRTIAIKLRLYMGDIKYSIIIPAYNLAFYIESTLKTIYKTGLQGCELIIIDDGSSDDTLDIVNGYLAYNKALNCHVFKQQNSGVSNARNVGIDVAQGEYLIFFDGDDSCDKDIIMKISEACEEKPDMLVWRFNIVDCEKKHISQDFFEKQLYSSNDFTEYLLKGIFKIRIGSFAVKKSLVMENDLKFTEGCSICEDVEFMYKCVLASESIHTINDVLYDYIKREGSAANTYDLRRFQAPFAIKRIYDYAAAKGLDGLSEYVVDGLKNGLLITHAMYSFDSCCKYIKGNKQFREFIGIYKSQFGEVEKLIKESLRNMKYVPDIYSKKRFMLFKLSRILYAFVMCIK